jgi:catechol 2,3-dioxygenase-like lactoylglutathione lyase family enzyme
MASSGFITGIDHVELYVSDFEEAIRWYERVFGFSPDDTYDLWRQRDGGPLIVAVAETTKLALFEKESAIRGDGVSPNQIAFQTNADGFMAFVDRLQSLALTDRDGEQVSRADVVDHDLSYSLYFTDVDGNRLELTTNDYEEVAARLE